MIALFVLLWSQTQQPDYETHVKPAFSRYVWELAPFLLLTVVMAVRAPEAEASVGRSLLSRRAGFWLLAVILGLMGCSYLVLKKKGKQTITLTDTLDGSITASLLIDVR